MMSDPSDSQPSTAPEDNENDAGDGEKLAPLPNTSHELPPTSINSPEDSSHQLKTLDQIPDTTTSDPNTISDPPATLKSDASPGGAIPATVKSSPAELPATANVLPKTTGMVPPEPSPADGKPALGQIGNFRLTSQLGEGGMGVVYKARHINLPLIAAIKQIRPSAASRNAVARFHTEAAAMAKLQHPNIVRILDFGEFDGAPYYALEYVDGGALTDKLQGKPQDPKWTALLLEKVARAVHAAHEHGFIHRDLKPPNILLDERGEPKVTDFGLVKLLEDDGQDEITTDGYRPTIEGEIMGSPNYMAPEQATGEISKIGPPTDVYGIGAILFEMLTGRPPFVGQNVNQILEQVRNDDPLRPRLFEPHIPKDLETICLRCLEKEPSQRIPTCRELADALRCFLNNEPIPYTPVTVIERATKWSKRNPALAALIGVIVLATAGLFGGGIWYNAQLSSALVKARTGWTHAEENADVARENLEEANLRLSDALAFKARLKVEEKQPLGAMVYLAEARQKSDSLRVKAIDFAVPVPLVLYERRLSHESGATAVAFDSKHGWIATALQDGSVVVWDPETGDRKAVLKDHSGPVLAVAFSPNGSLLAAGTSDGTVHLWDPAKGTRTGRLTGHTEPVHALAFSGDGKRLASGGLDLDVRVWDPASSREVAILKGHHDMVASVAFHPTKPLLASGSLDRTVRIWNLDSRTMDRELLVNGQRAGVTSIAFSPNGADLAAGAEDRRVRIWHLATPGKVCVLKGHRERVRAVAFSRAGDRLVSGGDDEDVVIWDVKSCSEAARLEAHDAAITAVAFNQKGDRLATASLDQTVRLWNAATGRRSRRLEMSEELLCSTVSPDGQWVAAGSEASVYLWKRPVRGKPRRLDGHTWDVTGVAFSPGSGTLASSSDDGTVRLWNVASGKQEAELKGRDNFSSVLFSPDGKYLVAGSWDRTIWVWETASREVRGQLEGHKHYVTSIDFSPTGKVLASGSWDGSIRFWDLNAAKETGSVNAETKVDAILFHPSGDTLAARLRDQSLALFDVKNSRLSGRLPGHQISAGAIAFSPDGRILATAAGDGSIRLWDAKVRQERARLVGHRRTVTSLIFSSDNRLLISSSEDRAVRFWGSAVPESLQLAQRLSGMRLSGLDLVPLTVKEEVDLIEKYPDSALPSPDAKVKGQPVDVGDDSSR